MLEDIALELGDGTEMRIEGAPVEPGFAGDVGNRDLLRRLLHDKGEIALLKKMERPQGVAVAPLGTPLHLPLRRAVIDGFVRIDHSLSFRTEKSSAQASGMRAILHSLAYRCRFFIWCSALFLNGSRKQTYVRMCAYVARRGGRCTDWHKEA
jgi:hypothetical protein